jgi:hypothetical protein
VWTAVAVAGLAGVMSCNAVLGIRLYEDDGPDANVPDGQPDSNLPDGQPDSTLPDGEADSNLPDGQPDSDAPPLARYPSAVLLDHPVLYLRLGEPLGAKDAFDELDGASGKYSISGNTQGVDGALSGDPDTAVTFNGLGNGIVMPPGVEFDGTKPFSVEFWVREIATVPQFAFILDHEPSDGTRRGWVIHTGAVNWRFERWSDAGKLQGAGPLPDAAYAPGAWHYVVGTVDGSTMRFYVDKDLVDEQPLLGVQLPAIGVPWRIGASNCNCNVAALHGDLDEVAIYDYPLMDSQIQNHFTAAQAQ